MRSIKKYTIEFLFWLSLIYVSNAADIPVYLEMDTTGEPLMEIAPDSVAISTAKSISNKKSDKSNWYVTKITQNVTGYIPQDRITKGLTIRPGSLLFQYQSLNSPAITLIDKNSEKTAFVKTIQDGWAEVELLDTVTVYFQKNNATTTAHQGENSSKMKVSKSFSGKLKLKKKRTMQPNDYQLELINQDGSHLADIDTESLITTNPIHEYLDKQVCIYGITENTSYHSKTVIKARSIRLN